MNSANGFLCKAIFLFFCGSISYGANAQGEEVVHGNLNTWFLLLNRLNLNDKWSITNEFHERTGDFLHDQAQFIWRPSIDYHWGEQVELSVGYSFLRNNSYEPYFLPLARNENNIWSQILLKNQIGKVLVQHRIRQENRWIDKYESVDGLTEINGTTFNNRFRYRITATLDVWKLNEDQAVFFNFFDELWVNQNDNLSFQDFFRNWVYLGLGYRFNPGTNLQLGYMHQSDRVTSTSFIRSSIIQTTFIKNFRIKPRRKLPGHGQKPSFSDK